MKVTSIQVDIKQLQTCIDVTGSRMTVEEIVNTTKDIVFSKPTRPFDTIRCVGSNIWLVCVKLFDEETRLYRNDTVHCIFSYQPPSTLLNGKLVLVSFTD